MLIAVALIEWDEGWVDERSMTKFHVSPDSCNPINAPSRRSEQGPPILVWHPRTMPVSSSSSAPFSSRLLWLAAVPLQDFLLSPVVSLTSLPVKRTLFELLELISSTLPFDLIFEPIQGSLLRDPEMSSSPTDDDPAPPQNEASTAGRVDWHDVCHAVQHLPRSCMS